MKVMRLLVVLVPCGLLTSILRACGAGGASNSSASGPTVHMNSTKFAQAEITIRKGQSVMLINDDLLTPHIIANGTWENGTAKPEEEPTYNNPLSPCHPYPPWRRRLGISSQCVLRHDSRRSARSPSH
ncbi:hypothetical protein [Reticulibacter mediterranei]|uniref:hypothetical protein n=1 Tax=Reticulibacter mediterranei TaxID=2778369 RepID=UPI001C68F9D5|nr:hypothetical protein [Reticulibacter mediterranei]